jgi:hypothetical protein
MSINACLVRGASRRPSSVSEDTEPFNPKIQTGFLKLPRGFCSQKQAALPFFYKVSGSLASKPHYYNPHDKALKNLAKRDT